GQQLRPLRGDDDDAAGDRDRRERRRPELAAVRVPLQAGRSRPPPRLRRPPSAPPGLADVVRRPRPLRAEPLAAAPLPAAAGGLPARVGPARVRPLRRPSAPLRPRPALRLPLHRPGPPPPDRRLVAAAPGRRVLPPVTSKPLDRLTAGDPARLKER